jgi:hypothetical protein
MRERARERGGCENKPSPLSNISPTRGERLKTEKKVKL